MQHLNEFDIVASSFICCIKLSQQDVVAVFTWTFMRKIPTELMALLCYLAVKCEVIGISRVLGSTGNNVLYLEENWVTKLKD